jgi:hypothetical protein
VLRGGLRGGVGLDRHCPGRGGSVGTGGVHRRGVRDITWFYRRVLDKILASPDAGILERYILASGGVETEEANRRRQAGPPPWT